MRSFRVQLASTGRVSAPAKPPRHGEPAFTGAPGDHGDSLRPSSQRQCPAPVPLPLPPTCDPATDPSTTTSPGARCQSLNGSHLLAVSSDFDGGLHAGDLRRGGPPAAVSRLPRRQHQQHQQHQTFASAASRFDNAADFPRAAIPAAFAAHHLHPDRTP
ncbi:hypothetical protein LPJ61_001506, partial [Coemansia biformis]